MHSRYSVNVPKITKSSVDVTEHLLHDKQSTRSLGCKGKQDTSLLPKELTMKLGKGE